MIDAGLGRKNHGSIPHNCYQKGAESLEPLNVRIDLRTKLDGPVGQIQVVKEKQKEGVEIFVGTNYDNNRNCKNIHYKNTSIIDEFK
jgi:hypothetical protein